MLLARDFGRLSMECKYGKEALVLLRTFALVRVDGQAKTGSYVHSLKEMK
jgi:hypothetical protein